MPTNDSSPPTHPQTAQEIGAALAASNLASVPLGLLEQAAILAALKRYNGNRTHAARQLGISVRTLQRKMKLWRIVDPPLVD
jgi:DNA-binding NtrC family response regulator